MLYTGSPSSSPSPFHCHIWNLFVCSLHKQCFFIHWNSQETHFFTAQGSALRSNDTYICTSCTRITFTAKTPLWPIYKDVDLRNISSSSAGRILFKRIMNTWCVRVYYLGLVEDLMDLEHFIRLQQPYHLLPLWHNTCSLIHAT